MGLYRNLLCLTYLTRHSVFKVRSSCGMGQHFLPGRDWGTSCCTQTSCYISPNLTVDTWAAPAFWCVTAAAVNHPLITRVSFFCVYTQMWGYLLCYTATLFLVFKGWPHCSKWLFHFDFTKIPPLFLRQAIILSDIECMM